MEELKQKRREYILDGMGGASTDDRRKAARILKQKLVSKKEFPSILKIKYSEKKKIRL